jgi:hypothetical protein
LLTSIGTCASPRPLPQIPTPLLRPISHSTPHLDLDSDELTKRRLPVLCIHSFSFPCDQKLATPRTDTATQRVYIENYPSKASIAKRPLPTTTCNPIHSLPTNIPTSFFVTTHVRGSYASRRVCPSVYFLLLLYTLLVLFLELELFSLLGLASIVWVCCFLAFF